MYKIARAFMAYKPVFLGLLVLVSFFAVLQVTGGRASALGTESATYSNNNKTITVNGIVYTEGDDSLSIGSGFRTFTEGSTQGGECYISKLSDGLGVIQVPTTDPSKGTLSQPIAANHCDSTAYTLNFTNAPAATAAASTSPADAQQGTNTDPELNCNWDSSPLAWIMCPLTHLLTGAVTTLDGYMNSLLTINTQPIFDTKNAACKAADPTSSACTSQTSAQAYYTAWGNMRNIALALMLIAGLVMVVAQALGYEILDAYTVRKVMPRILIVAIGISLSWPFMEFLINLTNDVGGSVREIIYAPFSGIHNGTFGLRGGGNALAAALVLPGVVALKFGGVMSLAGTALLALGVGFLVMILRQIAITMLVVLAPFAIACYILPNTQKAYQFWWDAFSKALIMFPIIAAFIAAGRVFAVTASSLAVGAPGGLGSVYEVSSVIAYIAPYFLLPLTVRFAGGLVGTLGGFVNDRSRGAFDRLKNYRKQRVARSGQELKSGEYFKGTNRISRGLNTASSTTAAVGAAGFNPKMMGANVRGRMAANNTAYRKKFEESSEYNAVKGSEQLTRTAFDAKNDTEAEAMLKKNYGRTDRQAKDGAAAIRLARRAAPNASVFQESMQMALASTNTGYREKDEDGNDIGGAKFMEDVHKVAGKDLNMAGRMIAEGRSRFMQGGRIDRGGAAFGESLGVYAQVAAAASSGTLDNNARRAATLALSRSANKSQSGAVKLNGRKDSLENLIPVMKMDLDDALAGNDEVLISAKLAEMDASYNVLSQTSPEKAEAFATGMMSQRYNVAGGVTKSVREMIEERRSDGAFQDRSKQFQEEMKPLGPIAGAGRGPVSGRDGPYRPNVGGSSPL
jgi:hypothetical protein